jgi:hypothetical protein
VLTVDGGAQEIFLIAAKPGFFNSRTPLPPHAGPVRLQLQALPAGDNAGYAWQDPSPSADHKDNCGNCHTRIYSEWTRDAHSRAAVNPIVLSMYNGTDLAGRANVSPGLSPRLER